MKGDEDVTEKGNVREALACLIDAREYQLRVRESIILDLLSFVQKIERLGIELETHINIKGSGDVTCILEHDASPKRFVIRYPDMTEDPVFGDVEYFVSDEQVAESDFFDGLAEYIVNCAESIEVLNRRIKDRSVHFGDVCRKNGL